MNKKSVIAYFCQEPLPNKVFIWLRLCSCPFDDLIRLIPVRDTILDIGCGYGILPLMLARSYPDRSIVGLDPDRARIEAASKAARTFKNLRFVAGTTETCGFQRKFSLITIVDVLYLLPFDKKRALLRRTSALLQAGGNLIIKINDRSRSPRYFLTWLQEYLTVKLLKKTVSHHDGLYFETVNDVGALLADCQLHVVRVERLRAPFPFFHPHWLIIAVK